MREIKFRAWDNLIGDWYDWDCGPIVDYEQDKRGFEVAIHTQNNIVFEQFTGLRDKNGKEIYEGDVVNYKWGTEIFDDDDDDPKNVYENTSVVEFRDGAFCPRPYRTYCEDSYYSEKAWDFEVIGNIHENPELLGGKGE